MTKGRTRKLRVRPSKPIHWTDRALSDLEAIGEYIARDSPAAAARWVTRLMTVAENVALAPRTDRRVPELARADVRETFLRTYRIVYRLRQDRMEILTVFEGHRRFPTDLARPGREEPR